MLELFNTRIDKKDKFIKKPGETVTIYACGPTVYDYAHIGNFRTYVTTDILVRALRFLGYKTKYVMNITDVGHLTSDNDSGEDKLEKGARREGKTAWEIAEYYTDAFLEDSRRLNLIVPDERPKPTEHIEDQIKLISVLLKKKYAYKIDDGIYFDTAKFENYGSLTVQEKEDMLCGVRVEKNVAKKNQSDFALWKFSPKDKKRHMEWESPWGVGFPGWHIECSAMSMKFLGNQIDIHTGGVDLIPIHHNNEIAQSEAMTGKTPFVKFWIHGQFLLVDGQRMSKSKDNFYNVSDIIKRGYDPLALRYYFLTAHYRSFLNFTWEGLRASGNAYNQLKALTIEARTDKVQKRTVLSNEKLLKIDNFRNDFISSLEDDLNIPKALSIAWEMMKSNIPPNDKYDLILLFDQVLGLGLSDAVYIRHPIPKEIKNLAEKRKKLKEKKEYHASDELRKIIEQKGYLIKDTEDSYEIIRK